MVRYLDPRMKRNLVNAIFRGKLLFAIETWGGTSMENLKLIQKQQDWASRLALGKEHAFKSSNQRQKMLNWLCIKDEVCYATLKMTHAIINTNDHKVFSELMPLNNSNLRLTDQQKLGTKPRFLMKNKQMENSFCLRAYQYNTLPAVLTQLRSKKLFKKNLKKFMITGSIPKHLKKK